VKGMMRQIVSAPVVSRDEARVEKLASCCAGTLTRARAWVYRFKVSRGMLGANEALADCPFPFAFLRFLLR